MVEIVYTSHAELRIQERGIPKYKITEMLSDKEEAKDGDLVFQSVLLVNNKKYLCRVFCVKEGNLFKVLTAYITSDIKRYGESNDR